VSSLLQCCCGGAVCWRPAISLPTQSVSVGEVGRFVGVLWRAVVCVGVLLTGPVAAGVRVYSSVDRCCLLVLDSVTSTLQCIRQPRPCVYLKEGTYHTRLFRGPSTNGMKKWDGPSRSWPTPHTTPLFLPPEDPSQVLLLPNLIPG
jgi:hypothetical protein